MQVFLLILAFDCIFSIEELRARVKHSGTIAEVMTNKVRHAKIKLKKIKSPLPKNEWHRLARKRKAVTTQEYTPEERAWDELQLASRKPHYMQSSAWAESKARSQWPVSRCLVYGENDSLPLQVFSRTVPGLGRLHYAPQASGITKDNIPSLTRELHKQYGKGLVFKLEPYQIYSDELLHTFEQYGWMQANSVQYRHTVIVNLNHTNEELLASFKKRARYEVRLAQRNNVRVEKHTVTQEKLNLLSTLMGITAKRSGAFFRKNTYTDRYWQSFSRTGQGSLYFAWHNFDLLAGAYVVTYGETAWYKDGGSVRHKANLMGPRLLQWEIMRDLQAQGIKTYDLSGIPADNELETSSMKGLYTFKTAFSRETTQLMPALELPFGHRYPIWPKTERQFLRLYSGFTKDFWY